MSKFTSMYQYFLPNCLTSQTRIVLSLGSLILLLTCISCTGTKGKARGENLSSLDPLWPINPLSSENPFAPSSTLVDEVAIKYSSELNKQDLEQIVDESQRNALIYKIFFLADYQFSKYEADLLRGRASQDSFIELTRFGLTSAAQFTSTARAAKLLSAIAGGLGFARSTTEKNFYSNNTLPVLIARMKVLRKEKRNEILEHSRQKLEAYPTPLALVEVLEYWNRGTIMGALHSISEETTIQELRSEGITVAVPKTADPLGRQITSGSLVVKTFSRDLSGPRKIPGNVTPERDPEPRTAPSSIVEQPADPILDPAQDLANRKQTVNNIILTQTDLAKLKAFTKAAGLSEPPEILDGEDPGDAWIRTLHAQISDSTLTAEKMTLVETAAKNHLQ